MVALYIHSLQFCKLRYEFQDCTLNPSWDYYFRIPLPIMDSCFVNYSTPSKDGSRSLLSESRTFLDDSSDSLRRRKYDADCQTHFRWWSGGILKVEVVDGDRFNDDIFMGEVRRQAHCSTMNY